jgi:hypothetical protein
VRGSGGSGWRRDPGAAPGFLPLRQGLQPCGVCEGCRNDLKCHACGSPRHRSPADCSSAPSDERRFTCLIHGPCAPKRRPTSMPRRPQQLAPVSLQAGRPCRGELIPRQGSMIVGCKAPRESQLIPGPLLVIPLASGRGWLSCRACRSVLSGRANIDVFNLDLPTSLPNDPLDPDLHFSRPA